MIGKKKTSISQLGEMMAITKINLIHYLTHSIISQVYVTLTSK